jgi:hypothetical protein
MTRRWLHLRSVTIIAVAVDFLPSPPVTFFPTALVKTATCTYTAASTSTIVRESHAVTGQTASAQSACLFP